MIDDLLPQRQQASDATECGQFEEAIRILNP